MSKSVWQSQALDAPQISLEFVKHQAEKLNADFRSESNAVLLSAIACVLLLGVVIWNPHYNAEPITQVLRVSAVLLLLGSAYIAFRMRPRGRAILAQHQNIGQSLDAYRNELKNRRDLYWGAWRWSVWPMVPALVVVFVGGLMYDPRPNQLLRYALAGLFALVGSAFALWHYKRKGDFFQRELEALNSLEPANSSHS